jgi:hypothetical protein
MSRFGLVARQRLACGAAAVSMLASAACSGTVEASYRPPPPPPPTPVPTTVAPTPTPTTAPAVAAGCGPDQIAIEVGDLQSDANSRAVRLVIRASGAQACGVTNPVGIELLDASGAPLTTHVETADLPSGRTAVDTIPAEAGPAASGSPATPSGAAPAAPNDAAPAASADGAPTSASGGNSVMVWLQWRAEPSSKTADPTTDCVDAQSLLLTLADAAPPIPIPAKLTACDGGTVYVSPAEADAG